MPEAPVLGAAKKVKLDETAFGARFLGTARASERARRAGRAPSRTAATEDPGDGLRRRRQAVAPEGHRSRARRLEPLTDLDRRRHRVRSAAALLHLQGQPQGAARRAAQRPVAARRARLDRDSRRGAFSTPKTRQALELLEDWSAARPTLVVLGAGGVDGRLSFRNLARVAVLTAENVGVTDLLGAASILVSEPALPGPLRACGHGSRRQGGEGLMDHSR